jgi:archaellum component FlaC
MTWQMEAFADNVLAKPEVAQSLGVADTIAKSAERVSRVAEKIPQQVAQEREAVMSLIEDRNGRLSKLFGEVRSTTDSANKVAETSERLTANLRDTAKGFTETSNAVNALLTKHSGPPNPNAKPFDIEPIMQTSMQVNQSIAGLNTLLAGADTLATKKPWAAPMQDADALLSQQIDRVFWRALLLIVAFFVLLLAYRWLTVRWLTVKPAL